MNVIFVRPLRLGKKNYPKGKRSVDVPDADLNSDFAKKAIEAGWIVIPAAPKPAEKSAAPAAASAAPAKGK